MITSDYRNWLNSIDFDLDDQFDEIHSLYRTIRDEDPDYGISFRKDGENLIVTYPEDSESELELTPENKMKFLSFLDSLFELTVEGEYALRQAMSHND